MRFLAAQIVGAGIARMNHVNRGPKTFCLFLRYSGEPTERSAVLVRQVKLKESIIILANRRSEAQSWFAK